MKTQNPPLRARVNTPALELALKFHGWSYRELAKRSDVSVSAISQYMNGYRSHCTVETARKLAEALKVDTADIFFLESENGKVPSNFCLERVA